MQISLKKNYEEDCKTIQKIDNKIDSVLTLIMISIWIIFLFILMILCCQLIRKQVFFGMMMFPICGIALGFFVMNDLLTSFDTNKILKKTNQKIRRNMFLKKMKASDCDCSLVWFKYNGLWITRCWDLCANSIGRGGYLFT